MKLFCVVLSLCWWCVVARGAEEALRAGEVVALVGGEEMVAAAEHGALEGRLVRALPTHRLKVRCLAWEGDTVFAQERELNYPTLEQQLEEVGATVVLAQFGLMESRAGAAGVEHFTAAYEKLVEQWRAGGKRRVMLLEPVPMPGEAGQEVARYAAAVREVAGRLGVRCLHAGEAGQVTERCFRDGRHLNEEGHERVAVGWAQQLTGKQVAGEVSTAELQLSDAIHAKNRMWYHYARPQNWAFLNGDRTAQPSSRDHVDPSKRWFPEEMKQWLPLVAAKEEQIWAEAVKLSTSK